LGGTKTEIIALDERGVELYRKRVPTNSNNYNSIVTTIAGLVFRKASTEMSEATTIVPEEKPSSGQGTSGSSAPAPAAATPAGSTSVAETGESSPAADAPSDDR
jgi:fructokinase